MAELINLAGTTSHSFTIGENGVTTYHGKDTPPIEVGKPGDIYIQDTTEIIEGGEDTGEFRPYGKIFMKLVVDGVTVWEPIKNYSFDTPIITHEETEEESNNYKISLQSAKAPSTATTSTKANDYEKNHDNFGVTRYGTNAEVVASDITDYQTYSSTNLPTNFDTNGQKFMDKNITLTPKQVADNIKVEMKRAITVEGTLNSLNNDLTKTDLVTAINSENTRAKGVEGTLSNLTTSDKSNLVAAINSEVSRAKGVEGKLSDLTTDDKSNLVAAINSEKSRAVGAEGNLQDQIDAIVSKSDVVDVVSCYDRGSDTSKTDIVHYNTSTLGDNDVIKVLIDEQHDDATTYYRWDVSTQKFEYIGPEGSYYTKGESDTRFVNATGDVDETITGTKTFNTTPVVGTLTQTNNSTSAASTAYVRTAISNEDALVVHLAGEETITGQKTFSSSIKETSAIDNTSTSGSLEKVVLNLVDKNDNGIASYIAGRSNTRNSNEIRIKNASGNWFDLRVNVDDSGKGWISTEKGQNISNGSLTDATASTSDETIPTKGWVNNPATSTNVVHRTGDESIAGTKTFTGAISATGATVTVATQTRGDSSTKAASTAFVADGLSLKVDKSSLPSISTGTNGQVLSNNGSAFVWKTVRDITTLGGLDDTAVDNEQNDQSLVFDSSIGEEGAWVNKRPIIATISYW